MNRYPYPSICEAIRYVFSRSAGLANPALSDEAAFVIISILDDRWLWFHSIYGGQARSYRPPQDIDPDDISSTAPD